jgi:hypothetical protein
MRVRSRQCGPTAGVLTMTMSHSRRLQGQAGVVGANLAIVIAFALLAVILLTLTTVSASSIDDRVEKINREVVTVDEELNNVPLLDQTATTAEQILEAARPLEQLAIDINTSARSIDPVVVSILNNAQTINRTVASIRGNLGTLRPVVVSINNGVATINRQANTVIGLAHAVKADTEAILRHVGGGGPGGHGARTIHGHVAGIQCSVNPAGCTS